MKLQTLEVRELEKSELEYTCGGSINPLSALSIAWEIYQGVKRGLNADCSNY